MCIDFSEFFSFNKVLWFLSNFFGVVRIRTQNLIITHLPLPLDRESPLVYYFFVSMKIITFFYLIAFLSVSLIFKQKTKMFIFWIKIFDWEKKKLHLMKQKALIVSQDLFELISWNNYTVKMWSVRELLQSF